MGGNNGSGSTGLALKDDGITMRLKRTMAGVALAALCAGTAYGQTVTGPQRQDPVAGSLDPTAESAPIQNRPESQFQLMEGVIASVNDQEITSFQLQQAILMMVYQSQIEVTPQNVGQVQREGLRSLIEQRLKAAELAKFEVKVSQAEIDAEIAYMANQQGTTAENFIAYLQSGGIRVDTLRDQVEVDSGWRKLIGGLYGQRAQVSKSQVDRRIARELASAAKTQYLIGEIYIDAARVGGMGEAMEGANYLVQQMVNNAPFQAVARQFSDAATRSSGGDAGWQLADEVNPALRTALENMQPGQLSRPIPVEGGVYILYMRDQRDGAATRLFNLKTIMVEAPLEASEAEINAATERLLALKPTLTCENIEQVAEQQQGLLAADMGTADIADMPPQFQQVARSGEVGSISNPVRTPQGINLLAVCGRSVGTGATPTFQEVENRLINANLSMFQRRLLRDLQDDAFIDVKQ